MKNIIKITLSAIALCLSAAVLVHGETLILKKTFITAKSDVPLSELCELETGIDLTVALTESKFIPNSEIAGLLKENGYELATIAGAGVDVIYLSEMNTLQDISDYLSAQYPDLTNEIQLPDLPAEFSLRDIETYRTDNEIAMNIHYYYVNNGKATEGNTLWVTDLPAEIKTVSLSGDSDILPTLEITRVDGDKAYVVYQNGDLVIRTVADVLETLSDGYYLVENTISGNQFTARLTEDD